jgi:hypothetical protein
LKTEDNKDNINSKVFMDIQPGIRRKRSCKRKTLYLEEGGNDLPTLEVPRQCPLVLLAEVRLREGKAIGSEEGKALGSGLFIYITFKIQFVPHRKHITSPLQRSIG